MYQTTFWSNVRAEAAVPLPRWPFLLRPMVVRIKVRVRLLCLDLFVWYGLATAVEFIRDLAVGGVRKLRGRAGDRSTCCVHFPWRRRQRQVGETVEDVVQNFVAANDPGRAPAVLSVEDERF